MLTSYKKGSIVAEIFICLMTELQNEEATFIDMSLGIERLNIKQQRALRYEISKHPKLNRVFSTEKIASGLNEVEQSFQDEVELKHRLLLENLRDPNSHPSSPSIMAWIEHEVRVDAETRNFARPSLRW